MQVRDEMALRAPITGAVVRKYLGGSTSIHSKAGRAQFFAAEAMLRYEWADHMLARSQTLAELPAVIDPEPNSAGYSKSAGNPDDDEDD